MAFNRKQKLRDNIEAVRTAFTLDRERRTPTERERALLERYCGFGGAARWAKSDLELFAPTVELHRVIRENSKDEMECKRYVDSLKASVLTAFYTPKAVTDTIADVLHDQKVRPGLVLEPSAGMGAFIGSVLSDNPQAEVMAFEKDLLTGKMLGHLYPEQKIRAEGFEKIEKPFLNRFDLAISNIPFGDIAVFDPEYTNGSVLKKIAAKKVHTYFFLKGLDAVCDGGIVAFITSQGVLNAESNGGTRYLMMKQADLLSAVRLPNNLFTEDANTEVGCDLIVLQKNTNKADLSEEDMRFTRTVRSNYTNVMTNEYFLDHPDRIIHTDAKRDTDPYGKPAMVYTHSGGVEGIATDLYRMLSADLSARLDLNRYNGIKEEKQVTRHTIVVQPQVQVQPIQPEVKKEENPVRKEPVQTESVTPEVEIKRPEAPVMDLYDLFGYTQEERRLAERGLNPGRQKGKPKRKKQPEQSLFPASELKQMEVKPEKVAEKPKPEPPVEKPAIDDDPEDAVYRSLDWETNPPINGFYEMMMSLTPERRAELRRLGREKERPRSNHLPCAPSIPLRTALRRKGKRKSSAWKGKCVRKKPP